MDWGGSESQEPARMFRGRISYNFGMRFGGRALGGVISLFALHLATHHFGPSRWGSVVAAMAFVAVFAAVSDFGLQSILSRDLSVPGNDSSSLFGAALVAIPMIVLPMSVIAALLDLALYSGHSRTRGVVYILLGTIPCMAVWLVSTSVLVARSRNDVRALLDVGSSLLGLGVIGVAIFGHLGVEMYAALLTASTCATAGASIRIASRYVSPVIRCARGDVLRLLRRSLPLGVSSSTNALYGQVDTIIISLLAASTAVAAFGVASQIAGFLVSIPSMLMVAMTPHAMRRDEAGRRVLLQRAFDVLVAIAAAVPLLAVIFCRGAVSAVAGGRYGSAVIPLMLLLCAAALAFPSAVLGQGLIFFGGEKHLPGTVATALVVNVLGNVFAVRLDGITGAALVMIASEAVVLVLLARSFRSVAGYLPSIVRGGKAACISAVLAAVFAVCDALHDVPSLHGPMLVPEVVVVITCYAVLVWVVGKLLPDGKAGGVVRAS